MLSASQDVRLKGSREESHTEPRKAGAAWRHLSYTGLIASSLCGFMQPGNDTATCLWAWVRVWQAAKVAEFPVDADLTPFLGMAAETGSAALANQSSLY